MFTVEDPLPDSGRPHGNELGHSISVERAHTVEYYVQHTDYFQTSSTSTVSMTDHHFRIMESILHSMQAWHKNGQCGLEFRPNLVVYTGKRARLTQRNDSQLDDYFIKHNNHEAVRSLLYTAPEVLRGLKSDDSASVQMADIWSFACLCLYLVSKRDPEYYRNDRQGKKQLVNEDRNAFVTLTLTIGEGKYVPEYLSYCRANRALKLLFRDCFHFDPTKRPSASMLSDSVLLAYKEAGIVEVGLHHNYTVEYHMQHADAFQTLLSATMSLVTDDQFRVMESVLCNMQTWHEKGQAGLEFRPNLVIFTGKIARLIQRNDNQLDDHFIKHNHHEAVRTLLYTAPETLRGISADNLASAQMADIWSFACFCLYVVSRRDPEYYRNDREGKKRLVNDDKIAFVTLTLTIGKGTYIPEYASFCEDNPALESFFRDCFQFEPSKRPSANMLSESMFPACKEWKRQVTERLGSGSEGTCQKKPLIAVHLLRMVASGAVSKVYQAKIHDTNEIVAVKCIPLDWDEKARHSQLHFLEVHINLMTSLHHPNLVRHILGIPQLNTSDPPIYQIIMEFCTGGTLYDRLRTFAVTPYLLQKWTTQIVDGVSFLHNQRCVHRDIKCSNILLTSSDPDTCTIKIADFGDIKRLLKEVTQTKEVSNGRGTWAFMSPELINGEDSEESSPLKIRLGRRTDIWSLGCVVIEMLNGALPDFHKSGMKINGDMAVMHFVGSGGGPTVPAPLPDVVDNFIRKCLQRDPNKRPWGHELRKHPMLTASELDLSGWLLPPRNLPSQPADDCLTANPEVTTSRKQLTDQSVTIQENTYGKTWNMDIDVDIHHLMLERIGHDWDYSYSHPIDLIGQGAYGMVYKATVAGKTQGRENSTVAVKKTLVSNFQINEMKEEKKRDSHRKFRRMLVMLKHPNLVSYFTITTQNLTDGAGIDFGMEFCEGGNLQTFLEQCRLGKHELSLPSVVDYARQISNGLCFLHQNHLMHGNLKPRNIFIKGTMNLRRLLIGSLDSAVQLRDYITDPDSFSLGYTANYMSPELVRSLIKVTEHHVDTKTDVWSLGCIILNLVERCLKFDVSYFCKEKAPGQLDKIGRMDWKSSYEVMSLLVDGYAPYVAQDIPQYLAEVIRSCFRNADERPASETVLRKLQELETAKL